MEVNIILTKKKIKNHVLFLSVTMIFALALCGVVSADQSVGGQNLATVQNGTVSGGVYSDSYYGFNGTGATGVNEIGSANINYTFESLPTGAQVKNATLYVVVYSSHMQDPRNVNVNVTFNGNQIENISGMSTTYTYPGDGGNDNTLYGGTSSDPYLIVNNHTVRVTSDYLMQYDVTSLMQQNNVVNVSTIGSADGRIKLISLIAAYDDGDSDQIMYWINQGQDVCSQQEEYNYDAVAVGSTTFNTSIITGTVEAADLKVIHLASNNGYYGFPTTSNNFVANGGSPTGTFTNVAPDRSTPDVQATYSGSDSWNVTSSVDGSSDVTLGYARNLAGTGNAGYWKVALAILTTKVQNTLAPVADFTVNSTTVMRNKTVQFNDTSSNTPTSWLWDFGDSTTSTDQNPTHTYATLGNYTVTLTASNAGGNDSEVKTDYITVVPQVDLTISGLVNTVPGSAVFAGETNSITVTNVKNNGPDAITNVVVSLYASDVNGGTTPVNSTIIASLASGATATVTLVDPTIRPVNSSTVYGASDVQRVTYTAKVDPDNLIVETNETNNNKNSAAKPVYYNGYKGQGLYEYNGTDINTQHVYELRGDIVYYTQPASFYKAVGWSTRTETWNGTNLPVPSTGTVQDVWLYLPYNWDYTADGNPNWVITFNGNDITNSYLAWYTDQSNFGAYANYKYGLMVFNVTSMFNRNGDNNLTMTALADNLNALYPSTLAVIYSDPNETFKQIFINEQCDELGLSASSYGTTLEEATTYANFTGMTIDLANLASATLHSFAGSAGPDEGNLLFNNNTVALLAWQGTSSTASALVANVTSYITSTGNVAAIQGTTSGGMDTLQQFLVVEYSSDLIITAINPNVGTGAAMFANEPNIISVTVKNNGTVASGATTLNVEVNGTTYTVNVPGLAAGASTNVTVTDTASHTGGSSVPVNANANPDRNIPETNTTNNSFSTSLTVYNNGYKGKQYTDDDTTDSIGTAQTWEGHYDVIYSSGNTGYNGALWTEKTYSWTGSDLSIPAGATVVSARLYQSYTYNQMGVDPSWAMNFNGNLVNTIGTYKDIKGFGTYNFPYGLYVYDVTSYFNTAGNYMTITPEAGNNYGIYGAYLIVVYQDNNTSQKKIYINEGFDMLCSRETYSVNDTEATANANFQDVSSTDLGNAKSIAILASAGDSGKSKFLFNGQEYTGFWTNYLSGSQIGFSTYDVTSDLQNGLNTAGMQSYDPTPGVTSTYGDNMYVMGSILVAAYGPADLVSSNLQLPGNPVQGTTYTVNATITNNGATNATNFAVKLYDNNTQKQKVTIASLGAGESTTVTFTWTPSTTGNHLLSVIADANNQITETSETNNQITGTSTVVESGLPDIIVSNLVLPENPTAGTTYTVNATVSNIGTDNAGTFVVKLYDNNTQIQKITLTGLTAGESTVVTFTWTPSTTGNHILSVIADANNQITETSETNNQITGTSSVTASTLPDITVSNLVLPDTPVAGTTYTVTATVSNTGTTAAGTFAVKLYDNNTQIQKITLTGLTAGESTTVTFSWTPSTTGNHNMSVIADANKQITETNENNNQIIKNTTVG